MPSNAITLPVDFDLSPAERQISSFVRSLPNATIPIRIDPRPLGAINGQVQDFTRSIDAASARTLAFGATVSVIGTLAEGFRALVKNTLEVNQALTSINAIVGLSDAKLNQFGKSLFDIAKNTGQSFASVASVAQDFARQTDNATEVLKRTNAALILTRVSGLDADSAVKVLTASLSTYKDELGDVNVVLNKIIAADIGFAVSAKDIAEGISRSAAAAKDAKISFDSLVAIITAAQAATQRGGASIGNAFKTIFTKIDRPEVLDQLEQLGISVRNIQGATLPAIQILSQLAQTYDHLSDAQKSNVTQLIGSVYQVNVLKATLGDLSNQYGTYNRSLNASINAGDTAINRNNLLNKSYASLANSAQASFTQISSKIGDLTVAPLIKNVLGGFNNATDAVQSTNTGKSVAEGFLKGIGDYISGPGLILAGALGLKFFGQFASFALKAGESFAGIGVAGEKQKAVLQGVNGLLQQQPELYSKILSVGNNRVKQEQLVLELIEQQNRARETQNSVASAIGSSLYQRGATFSGGAFNLRAGGFVPNFLQDQERNAAASHGYSAGNVIPFQTKGQDSGLTPSQFINQAGIGRASGFVPNFANAVVNTNEYQLSKAGSNAVGIIPPNDAARIDPIKAASQGYSLSKLGAGFVPNFVDTNLYHFSSNRHSDKVPYTDDYESRFKYDPTRLIHLAQEKDSAAIADHLSTYGGKFYKFNLDINPKRILRNVPDLFSNSAGVYARHFQNQGILDKEEAEKIISFSDPLALQKALKNKNIDGFSYKNKYEGVIKDGLTKTGKGFGDFYRPSFVLTNPDIIKSINPVDRLETSLASIRFQKQLELDSTDKIASGFIPNFDDNFKNIRKALSHHLDQGGENPLESFYDQHVPAPESGHSFLFDDYFTRALASLTPTVHQEPFSQKFADKLNTKKLGYVVDDYHTTSLEGNFGRNISNAQIVAYDSKGEGLFNLDFVASQRGLKGYTARNPASIGENKYIEGVKAGLAPSFLTDNFSKFLPKTLSAQEVHESLISAADKKFPQGWVAKPIDARLVRYKNGQEISGGAQSAGVYTDNVVKSPGSAFLLPRKGYLIEEKLPLANDEIRAKKKEDFYTGRSQEHPEGLKYDELFTSPEYRVHVLGASSKAATKVVPYATFRKDDPQKFQGDEITNARESDEIKKVQAAALEAVQRLPKNERNGVIFGPDVVKLQDGTYRVIELNPTVSKSKSQHAVLGASGGLDNVFVRDAVVGFLKGRKPLLPRLAEQFPNFGNSLHYGSGFIPNFGYSQSKYNKLNEEEKHIFAQYPLDQQTDDLILQIASDRNSSYQPLDRFPGLQGFEQQIMANTIDRKDFKGDLHDVYNQIISDRTPAPQIKSNIGAGLTFNPSISLLSGRLNQASIIQQATKLSELANKYETYDEALKYLPTFKNNVQKYLDTNPKGGSAFNLIKRIKETGLTLEGFDENRSSFLKNYKGFNVKGTGFVPNFNSLHDAISREASFGKQPVIGSAPELGIPIGVYNTDQKSKYGNLSNTIRADHLDQGQNPSTLSLTGSGKEKYTPNFASVSDTLKEHSNLLEQQNNITQSLKYFEDNINALTSELGKGQRILAEANHTAGNAIGQTKDRETGNSSPANQQLASFSEQIASGQSISSKDIVHFNQVIKEETEQLSQVGTLLGQEEQTRSKLISALQTQIEVYTKNTQTQAQITNEQTNLISAKSNLGLVGNQVNGIENSLSFSQAQAIRLSSPNFDDEIKKAQRGSSGTLGFLKDLVPSRGSNYDRLKKQFTNRGHSGDLFEEALGQERLGQLNTLDEKSSQRRFQGAFLGSIAAPILGGVIGSTIVNPNGQNPQGEKIANGIGSAVGTFAQFAAFGPQAAVVGAVVASFQALDTTLKNIGPDFEELSKASTDYADKQKEISSAAGDYIEAQQNYTDALNHGASPAQLGRLQKNSSALLQKVTDPNLSSQLSGTSDIESQLKILDTFSEQSGKNQADKKFSADLAGFSDKFNGRGIGDRFIRGAQYVKNNPLPAFTGVGALANFASRFVGDETISKPASDNITELAKEFLASNRRDDPETKKAIEATFDPQQISLFEKELARLAPEIAALSKAAERSTETLSILADFKNTFSQAGNQAINGQLLTRASNFNNATNANDLASGLAGNRRDFTNQSQLIDFDATGQRNSIANQSNFESIQALGGATKSIIGSLAKDESGGTSKETLNQRTDIINQIQSGQLFGSQALDALQKIQAGVQNRSVQDEIKATISEVTNKLGEIQVNTDSANQKLANSVQIQRDLLTIQNNQKAFGGIDTLLNPSKFTQLTAGVSNGLQSNINTDIANNPRNTFGLSTQFDLTTTQGKIAFAAAQRDINAKNSASTLSAVQDFQTINPNASAETIKSLSGNGASGAGDGRVNQLTTYINGLLSKLTVLNDRSPDVVANLKNSVAKDISGGRNIDDVIASVTQSSKSLTDDPAAGPQFKNVLNYLKAQNTVLPKNALPSRDSLRHQIAFDSPEAKLILSNEKALKELNNPFDSGKGPLTTYFGGDLSPLGRNNLRNSLQDSTERSLKQYKNKYISSNGDLKGDYLFKNGPLQSYQNDPSIRGIAGKQFDQATGNNAVIQVAKDAQNVASALTSINSTGQLNIDAKSVVLAGVDVKSFQSNSLLSNAGLSNIQFQAAEANVIPQQKQRDTKDFYINRIGYDATARDNTTDPKRKQALTDDIKVQTDALADFNKSIADTQKKLSDSITTLQTTLTDFAQQAKDNPVVVQNESNINSVIKILNDGSQKELTPDQQEQVRALFQTLFDQQVKAGAKNPPTPSTVPNGGK